MKILQNSQKYFATLGIGSEQIKRQSLLNGKILIGFILLGYSLTGNSIYLIFEATSFDEYIECICSIVGIVVISTCFVTMVFGLTTLLDCIDDIESLIGTSEYKFILRKHPITNQATFFEGLQYPASKALFGKTNRLVEKISKIIFFVIARMSPFCSMLPKLFVCFFEYFVADMGSDSFELPFPMWYVVAYIHFVPENCIKFD